MAVAIGYLLRRDHPWRGVGQTLSPSRGPFPFHTAGLRHDVAGRRVSGRPLDELAGAPRSVPRLGESLGYGPPIDHYSVTRGSPVARPKSWPSVSAGAVPGRRGDVSYVSNPGICFALCCSRLVANRSVAPAGAVGESPDPNTDPGRQRTLPGPLQPPKGHTTTGASRTRKGTLRGTMIQPVRLSTSLHTVVTAPGGHRRLGRSRWDPHDPGAHIARHALTICTSKPQVAGAAWLASSCLWGIKEQGHQPGPESRRSAPAGLSPWALAVTLMGESVGPPEYDRAMAGLTPAPPYLVSEGRRSTPHCTLQGPKHGAGHRAATAASNRSRGRDA